MIVLGIESSCDETAVALYDGVSLNHLVHSQKIHEKYGGVVPELASRDHILLLLPLIDQLLKQSNLVGEKIDAIAVTKGPGLIGALMVGASIAQSLGLAWKIPVLGVHHMEAHIMAVMLEDKKPAYPFLALIVSGGHTMLVEVREFGIYRILGESLDDAAGEAFDKTAKSLGLGYPGGAALARLAEKGKKGRFTFSRPMLKQPGLEFSFSGLKTQVMQCIKQFSPIDEQTKADIADAFEEAIVDALIVKTVRALEQIHGNRLVIVGGVGANKRLRQEMTTVMQQREGEIYYPRSEFCTDNAAMVAYTGWMKSKANAEHESLSIRVFPKWEMFDRL